MVKVNELQLLKKKNTKLLSILKKFDANAPCYTYCNVYVIKQLKDCSTQTLLFHSINFNDSYIHPDIVLRTLIISEFKFSNMLEKKNSFM